jgi:hypothetical protein
MGMVNESISGKRSEKGKWHLFLFLFLSIFALFSGWRILEPEPPQGFRFGFLRMSETTPALDVDADHPEDELAIDAGAQDQTQPTAEILNVLEQLVPTAPNSQEQNPTAEGSTTPPPPRSEWQILRDKLRENPYDPEGWNKLVELAENSGELEEIKETYESLLEVYPNTVCHSPSTRDFYRLTRDPRTCPPSPVCCPNRVLEPLPPTVTLPAGASIIRQIPQDIAMRGSLEILSHLCQVK